MATAEQLAERRDDILRTAARHGARSVRVFGSTMRGEASAASDADFLVVMEPGRTLMDHVALVQDLEDLLGRSVDVVTEDSLHRSLRERILAEAMPL